jgi:hypothetical protein
MTQLIMVISVAVAAIGAVEIVARKRAVRLERETADLYEHYVAGIRELTQAYLLQAPSNDEWLAEIKARVLDTAEMPAPAGNVIRLPAASESITPPARRGPARILLRWALMLAGAAVTLAVPAVAVYFTNPTTATHITYLILAVFFAGFWLGVVAMVAVAMRKEDRLDSLSGAAPGWVTRGARWLTRFGSTDSPFRPRVRI